MSEPSSAVVPLGSVTLPIIQGATPTVPGRGPVAQVAIPYLELLRDCLKLLVDPATPPTIVEPTRATTRRFQAAGANIFVTDDPERSDICHIYFVYRGAVDGFDIAGLANEIVMRIGG